MAGLTWIEIIYWASTIIGGTLFLVRVIMLLMGGELGGDSSDTFLDSESAIALGDHADADLSFRLLSVQGLTSFFMMFGLVGLALLKADLPVLITVIGGMFAGLVTVAVSGVIFTQMKRLQMDGTINIKNTIGAEGSVYLTIPQGGTGQVQIIVQGSLKVFDAVSTDQNRIATGENIQVVGVTGGNTLIVEKTK